MKQIMMQHKNWVYGATGGLAFLLLLRQQQRLQAERQSALHWLPVDHDESRNDTMDPPNLITLQRDAPHSPSLLDASKGNECMGSKDEKANSTSLKPEQKRDAPKMHFWQWGYWRPAKSPEAHEANRMMQLKWLSHVRGHFADMFADTYDDPFYEDLQNMMLECDSDD